MRVTFVILLLASYLNSHSQQRRFDNYTTDILNLKSITFKKTVAYKIEDVTLLVDFEEYRHALDNRRSGGKTMLQSLSRDTSKLVALMRAASSFIDSFYTLINAQAATQDTIFLTQSVFDNAGFPGLGPMGNFFPDLIENGKCAILDKKNKMHFLIIREKGSSIGSFGGRMYYLPGQKKPFIIATDRLY